MIGRFRRAVGTFFLAGRVVASLVRGLKRPRHAPARGFALGLIRRDADIEFKWRACGHRDWPFRLGAGSLGHNAAD